MLQVCYRQGGRRFWTGHSISSSSSSSLSPNPIPVAASPFTAVIGQRSSISISLSLCLSRSDPIPAASVPILMRLRFHSHHDSSINTRVPALQQLHPVTLFPKEPSQTRPPMPVGSFPRCARERDVCETVRGEIHQTLINPSMLRHTPSMPVLCCCCRRRFPSCYEKDRESVPRVGSSRVKQPTSGRLRLESY